MKADVRRQWREEETRLSELAERYDALLCDVWGVLIDGTKYFPVAAAALENFRAQGGSVVLVTNASRPDAEVRRQLAGLRLPQNCFDDLVSAGELTLCAIVSRKGQACHHLGPARDNGLFEAASAKLGAPLHMTGVAEADYVVCTGLIDDRHEKPEDYDTRLAAMRARNLPMLCANPDIVVGVGDEILWCAGALAQRYEAMGGKVEQFGKPHPPIYEAALGRIAALRGDSFSPARILAIGDGAQTDLAGAGAAGLDCLFITDGVHKEKLRPDGGRLDLAALEELLTVAKARPVALARNVVW